MFSPRNKAWFAGVCSLALSTFALADPGNGNGPPADKEPKTPAPAFNGLWQAIDTFDGSTQHLSVICAREEGCDVRLNDTAFTLSCPDQIGFASGTGTVERNVLTVELTLYCSNLDGTSTLAGSQVNEFVLDRRTGTLTNLNDDPVELPNVFHRIGR